MNRFLYILLFGSLVVSASAQFVSADEIRNAVRTFVQQQIGPTHEEMNIEFRSSVSPVPVPPGQTKIMVGSGSARPLRGNVSIPVDVMVADSVVRRLLVSVRLRSFGTVLVAARQLDRGVELSTQDVVQQRVELTTLPEDCLVDISALKGMQTARIITAGSVLRECNFNPVPIIRQGDRVNVTVRSGRIFLRSEAVAREAGGKGNMISVQIAGKTERLRARIVAPGAVELDTN
jgi:flagella basal body P-ring formation protein FlgA